VWVAFLLALQWGLMHAHCMHVVVRVGSIYPVCGTSSEASAERTGTPAAADIGVASMCPGFCSIAAIGPPAPPYIHAMIQYALSPSAVSRAERLPPPARAPPNQPRAPPDLV